MKVLVCGGRTFGVATLKTEEPRAAGERRMLDAALNKMHAAVPITLVIEGGAPGADTLAHGWALRRRIPVLTHPADWAKHGRSAGYVRNTAMLTWSPDVVVAFPGGVGTANMIAVARRAGIKVIEVTS